jgi:hypothetical protein
MRNILVYDFVGSPLIKRIALHDCTDSENKKFHNWFIDLGIKIRLFRVYKNKTAPDSYLYDVFFTEEQLVLFVLSYYDEMRCYAGKWLMD